MVLLGSHFTISYIFSYLSNQIHQPVKKVWKKESLISPLVFYLRNVLNRPRSLELMGDLRGCESFLCREINSKFKNSLKSHTGRKLHLKENYICPGFLTACGWASSTLFLITERKLTFSIFIWNWIAPLSVRVWRVTFEKLFLPFVWKNRQDRNLANHQTFKRKIATPAFFFNAREPQGKDIASLLVLFEIWVRTFLAYYYFTVRKKCTLSWLYLSCTKHTHTYTHVCLSMLIRTFHCSNY